MAHRGDHSAGVHGHGNAGEWVRGRHRLFGDIPGPDCDACRGAARRRRALPAGTTVLASPAPSAAGFTMSSAAAISGSTTLTMGTEPVSLAKAKQWARVEFGDDDSLIADIITATREMIEGPELKRGLILQARTIYFMGFPWSGGYYNRLIRSMGPNPWWLPTTQGIIMLPYPPLQSVLSIKYMDPASGVLYNTIDPTKYVYTANSTPGRVQPTYGAVWPLARPQIDAVQITYTCGYGVNTTDIPASIRLAMRSIIAASYENREASWTVASSHQRRCSSDS